MRMLCGLSFPTSGQAQIAGYDLSTESEKIKQRIGYMSQKFSLYEDLTIVENIRFYGGIYGLTDQQIKVKTEFMLHQPIWRIRPRHLRALCHWDGSRRFHFR